MVDGRKTMGWGPAVGALVVGGMAVGAVWLTVRGSAPPVKPVYTREGYGGIRLPSGAGYGGGKAAQEKGGRTATTDPVAPALEAYNRGDYSAAESAARALLNETHPDAEQADTPSNPLPTAASMDQIGSVTHEASRVTKHASPNTEPGPTRKTQVRTPEHLKAPEYPSTQSRTRARARWVLAFSAARKKALAEAREQFAALRQEAAGQDWVLDEVRGAGAESSRPHPPLHSRPNPNWDRPVSPTGELLPTLEEEAAYQHAVLTAALASPKSGGRTQAGEKLPAGERKPSIAEAEREFVAFMRRYPESPLVHAAIRRIGRLHGGDIPQGAEAVWKAAMATAEKRRHARDRARSLCAPAVLAEVLRRTEGALPHAQSAPPAGVETLAREMNTDHRGTALSALMQAAEKRGLRVAAYRLTWRALLQKMPLQPGTPTPASRTGSGPQGSQPATFQPANLPTADPASRRTVPAIRFLVAFLEPGHVVLVEQAAAGVVRVWDPDGGGPQKPALRRYTQSEWLDRWKGVTLILEQ